MKSAPRHHLSLAQAAERLGHSVRWLRERARRGELEVFRWSPTDVTVSLESVAEFESRHRVTPRNQ